MRTVEEILAEIKRLLNKKHMYPVNSVTASFQRGAHSAIADLQAWINIGSELSTTRSRDCAELVKKVMDEST